MQSSLGLLYSSSFSLINIYSKINLHLNVKIKYKIVHKGNTQKGHSTKNGNCKYTMFTKSHVILSENGTNALQVTKNLTWFIHSFIYS